jgi:hypothetical protein
MLKNCSQIKCFDSTPRRSEKLALTKTLKNHCIPQRPLRLGVNKISLQTSHYPGKSVECIRKKIVNKIHNFGGVKA